MQYKKVLTRLTVIFIAIVIFLTFFSRTIVDLHVPRVSVAFIGSGVISPEAVSTGIVQPADTERIFAPASGRITQIVEEGDDINADTILLTISIDVQNLMDMLTQAEHERSLNALNIERARSEQAAEQQRLYQMISEPISALIRPTLILWEYDMQLESNTNDVARVQDEILSLEILYEEGIIPRQNILDREGELVRLAQGREQIYQRRDMAVQSYEAAIEAYEEAIANQDRIHEAQLQSQRDRITQLGFVLNMHLLETTSINRRISELMGQIEAGGVVEVNLQEGDSANRTITEIMPGMAIGANIHEGAPVMVTTLRNNRFEIEASFPQANDFIRTGQTVEIAIGGYGTGDRTENRIEGRITQRTPEGARNIFTIEVESNSLIGGELGIVTAHGTRNNQPAVIPLSALREDAQGYFILYVERVERAFGSNYYLRTQRVVADARDSYNVAITGAFGVSLTEYPIVINSDMPLQTGERVRLTADYDFIPTR